MKKEKMTFRATFVAKESETRSACCSFESPCLVFKANNGEVFRWFGGDKVWNFPIQSGQLAEITAIVTEANTLQRPVIMVVK